jgi:hypothetical protein
VGSLCCSDGHLWNGRFWNLYGNAMGSNGQKFIDEPTNPKGMIELTQNVRENIGTHSARWDGTARPIVIILQFIVGSLVTMGGTLFATFAVNNFGRSLGLIHLSIGLIGLAAGFIAIRGKPWSRTFLLAINGLTIAYSTGSESIVQLQSLLPSTSSLRSLIGTVIAIIMSGTILYLLLGRKWFLGFH